MAVFSLAALTVLDLAPPAMIELAARGGRARLGGLPVHALLVY